jgi:hypothetical protein
MKMGVYHIHGFVCRVSVGQLRSNNRPCLPLLLGQSDNDIPSLEGDDFFVLLFGLVPVRKVD